MKEKKLIAFDLYDTCFAFTLPQAKFPYKQLFSDLGILNSKHELKEILLTSHRSIEDIVYNILPHTDIDIHLKTYYNNLHNQIESVQLFPETVSVLSALKER